LFTNLTFFSSFRESSSPPDHLSGLFSRTPLQDFRHPDTLVRPRSGQISGCATANSLLYDDSTEQTRKLDSKTCNSVQHCMKLNKYKHTQHSSCICRPETKWA